MRSIFIFSLLAALCCLITEPAQAAKKNPSYAITDSRALTYFLNDGRKKHKECKSIKLSVGLPNYCIGNAPDGYQTQPGDGGFIDVTLTESHISKCGIDNTYLVLSGLMTQKAVFNMTFYNLPESVRSVFLNPSSNMCLVKVTLHPAPDNDEATYDPESAIEIECGTTAFYLTATEVAIDSQPLDGAVMDDVTLLENAKLVCVP